LNAALTPQRRSKLRVHKDDVPGEMDAEEAWRKYHEERLNKSEIARRLDKSTRPILKAVRIAEGRRSSENAEATE
jgi:hypothetical protein